MKEKEMTEEGDDDLDDLDDDDYSIENVAANQSVDGSSGKVSVQ